MAPLNGILAESLNAEDLKQRAKQLAETDRRKNDFLALLGHELRNPLAGIMGSVQAMQMIGMPSADLESLRAIIERQAGQMAALIDDLLDVSRISRGKISLRMQRVDLVEVVRRTIEDQRSNLEEYGCQLDLQLPVQPLWINADPTRLAQIVTNIVQNAAKFTNPGGTVTVRVSPKPESRAAQFVVVDTGIGMTPETLRSVFEPFQQGADSADRSEHGGLGLGMALVKGLVDVHGGEVEATSPGPGCGTQVSVEFPLESENLTPLAKTSDSIPPGPFRVLLIDDRRDTLLPLETILSRMGHSVVTATSSHDGLNAAKSHRPEIILSDLCLPDGLDGYGLAEAIRAIPALSDIYLVALSGRGDGDDVRRAMEAGFDYHLQKPVGKDRLEHLLSAFPRFQSEDSVCFT